jgi:hydrogenase/urease accessory protein HupE
VRNDRKLLTAPLIMIGLALSGRILTLGLEGVTQPQIQPLVIEAVLLVLLAAGRRNLGNR